MFEFSVRAVHRVGIDGDLANDLSDRWQLIARLELAPLERAGHLVDELTKGCSIRSGIEAKHNGGAVIAHVLVH